MSLDEDTNPTGAKAIKTQAAAWLERRDRADWSDADQAELDAWLAESTENYLFYHRVASAWARSQRLVVLRHPRPQALKENTQSKSRPLLVTAVAISAALAILGAGVTLLFPSPERHTFVTPVGGHETVTLKDGSSIELNTDTIVRTNIGSDHRIASIEKGEAFFKIAHDAGHPFTVTANNNKITVLGTKFSVRNEPNRVEVKLIDGKVWFASDNGKTAQRSALMTPGDVLVATVNSLTVAKRAPGELANDLGWRRGLLVFHHTALADAVSEYNRYNVQKIVIADAAAARLTVTGSLPANDTREFLTIAKKFFGLNVQRYGDEIVISR
jgi:transmembrane sensor